MSTKVTRPDLDAIEGRANAATPGPWFDQYEYDGARTVCQMRSTDQTFCVNKATHAPGEPPYVATKENGRFIGAARTDVPDLIAYARQLESALAEAQRERDRLREALEQASAKARLGAKMCSSVGASEGFVVIADFCDAVLTPIPESGPTEQGEKCMQCGKHYLAVYWIPQEMWSAVTEKTDGSGMLCIPCCDQLARSKGISLEWTAEVPTVAENATVQATPPLAGEREIIPGRCVGFVGGSMDNWPEICDRCGMHYHLHHPAAAEQKEGR